MTDNPPQQPDAAPPAPYRWLLSVMFLLPPERIHHLASTAIRWLGRITPLRQLAWRALATRDPILHNTVFGVDFPAPVGLAAGFDKDASAVAAWGALGFGFAEIGTVTAQPQPGNPQPRLFRLSADRGLLNRMGFNNHGAGAAANQLRRRVHDATAVPIGANIGKTKVVPVDSAIADYVESARLLGPLADFVVVNVSSPNTPGLRDLQAVEQLRPLLAAVQAAVDVPVLVKIAPDLADADILAVADVARELQLGGIVCTNTTISRAGLRTAQVDQWGAGGVSGPPVAARSLQVLRLVRAHVGAELAIISVGGVETAEQVYERLRAGASLVQAYTGFIYHGPLWTRRLHRDLAKLLRRDHFSSIRDAIGTDAPH